VTAVSNLIRPSAVSAAAPVAGEPSLFTPGIGGAYRTTDFDKMSAWAPGWAKQISQLGNGAFSGGLSFGQTGRMQFGVEFWQPGMLIRGDAPGGTVVFGFPLSTQIRARLRGLELREREVGVVARGQEIDFRGVGPYRFFVVALPEEFLQSHAEALLGRPVAGIVTTCRLSAGLSTAERQLQIEQLGLDCFYEHPARLADPAVARWVESKILDAIILSLPQQPPRHHAPGGAFLARRAEDYLQANLQAPLTIRDLCQAVGASERTLHLAFRQHLGTTPKAHLKALRLNAVRRELRTAPPGTGVMDVAMRWGFFHAGWLSQDYRRMFGESPSKALGNR
jgi:AraC family ethanolamine operon transcriptional activator